MRLRFLILMVAALLISLPLFSENGGLSVCVFLSVDLSEAEASEEYQSIIADACETELRNAGHTVIARDKWQDIQQSKRLLTEELVIGSVAIETAGEAGADLALTGLYRVESGRLLLDIKCYSVEQKRLLAAAITSGAAGLTVFNLINDAMLNILSYLEKSSSIPPSLFIVPSDNLREFILSSPDEGAEVLLAGKHPAGEISEGRISIYTAPDTDLHVTTSKPGYHPREETFRLGEEPNELKPLMKESVWGSEVLYSAGQTAGLGFGLRYYLLPDQLFISVEDYLYVQGFLGGDSNPIIHNDIGLKCGVYLFFEPHSPFRLGLSSGFGAVLTGFTAPEIPTYYDIYLNFLNGWFEWNSRNWITYLRFEGKFALDLGKNLLGGKWFLLNGDGVPVTLGVVRKW